MLTASSLIAETKTGNFKSLPSKVAANAAGAIHYRSDYELYWLRKSRREVTKLERLMRRCRTFVGVAALSRELREWCERERILLRIPLPREQVAKQASAGPVLEAASASYPPPSRESEPAIVRESEPLPPGA